MFEEMDKLLLEREQELGADNPALNQLIQRVRGRPFWYWNNNGDHEKNRKNMGDNCCFNHAIGLPVKHNESKPMFSYEGMVIRALMEPSYLNSRAQTEQEKELFEKKLVEAELKTKSKHENVRQAHEDVLHERLETLVDTKKFRHVACLKATGLGISELALRWILWMCLRNNDLYNSQVVIFTGPNILLSINLMNRLKNLLKPHGITFDDKETALNLPGNIHIECYPSFHSDSARGLPNISIIFTDEFSFFPDHEIDNIFDILNRNVVKSNSYLLAVSTPNKIDDAMDRLLKEDITKSIWKRIYLDYTYGLGKIFTEEINKIKGTNDKSFEREFCLKIGGTEGNVFSHRSIKKAQEEPYDPDAVVKYSACSVGIDPAFGGGSKAGVTATRYVNGKIQVIESDEYDQPSFQFLINKVFEIKRKHGVSAVFIDAAVPAIWAELKRQFGEIADSKYVFERLAECKKNRIKPYQRMKIIPVPFSIYHAEMLQRVKVFLDSNLLLIHPKFQKLLISLQSATAREYSLDKSGKTTQYHDILDSLRLSCQLYELK